MVMAGQERSDGLADGFGQACAGVERVHRQLAERVCDPHGMRAALEGVHQLTSAVAGLVSALMEQLPTVATTGDGYHPGAASEVLADLRSMHGCLNTGLILLEPTLDDLRGLTGPSAQTAPPQEWPVSGGARTSP